MYWFVYTAVAFLLLAPHFIPPVETTLLFCFKFGGVLKRSWKFASSTRFYPTRGKGVEFIQLLLVLNGGCDCYLASSSSECREGYSFGIHNNCIGTGDECNKTRCCKAGCNPNPPIVPL